jgi:diaminopimelate decarboxylase
LCEEFSTISRRFRQMAGRVEILYAMKASSTLAVRSIPSEEGAGAHGFNIGGLEAALATGAQARLVVLNGSNTSDAALSRAVKSQSAALSGCRALPTCPVRNYAVRV